MMPAAGAAVAVAAAPPPAAAAPADRSGSDCTDCSHCANRSRLRTRAGVRVSVNLRQFFSDQRARAFMWAPYGRCVQWLGRRIARVFGLPDDIALMCRGHMLPVMEPLLMLDRDDPVEVVNMSYVFTPFDQKEDPNVTSQRTGNESANRLAGRGRANVRPIQSNLTIKQEHMNQLPSSSSQGDNLDDHQNPSRVSPIENVETTMENSLDAQSIDQSKDLQLLKQRALRLLDEHCHLLHEASSPKRLRRRRRRRKLQAAANEPNGSDDEGTQRTPAPPDAAVLRNGSGSRSPRLVRALSPSPLLQYVL